MKAEKANRLLDYLVFMQPQWSRQIPIDDILETKEELDQLESDAYLGRCVKVAFEYESKSKEHYTVLAIGQCYDECEYDLSNIEELIEWGKQQGVE